MNIVVNVNVVYEFEVQCQFVWVKLLVCICYIGVNCEGVDVCLLDFFVGGFVFIVSGVLIQFGDLYKGKLLFQVDSISFFFEVEFQVCLVDFVSCCVGCEFQNFKLCEVVVLCYLIIFYLVGEVIGVGDMFNIFQCENFIKVCKQGGGNGGMGFFGWVWVVILSIVIFVVGVGVFVFIFNQMYNLYFVIYVDFGVVSVFNQQIIMFCEGIVQSFFGFNVEVVKGVLIVIFLVNLLDMFKGNLIEEQFNLGNIEKFFGYQMKGILISFCDCCVVQ